MINTYPLAIRQQTALLPQEYTALKKQPFALAFAVSGRAFLQRNGAAYNSNTITVYPWMPFWVALMDHPIPLSEIIQEFLQEVVHCPRITIQE
jgi:hypothetical protein